MLLLAMCPVTCYLLPTSNDQLVLSAQPFPLPLRLRCSLSYIFLHLCLSVFADAGTVFHWNWYTAGQQGSLKTLTVSLQHLMQIEKRLFSCVMLYS